MKLKRILMLLVVLLSAISSVSAIQISKEFVLGTYGEIGCSVGIGDCVYKITNNDGSHFYKLERSSLFDMFSIVYSKSDISDTINVGQTASISYTVKGSGADGFNAHNQKYEWYDANGNYIDNQAINLPFDKEYVWIHKLGGFNSPGTFYYTVIEYIEINIKNQNCLHLPCTPEYNQVWAKADEYYPKVIVNGGGVITPTPTLTVNPTYTIPPTGNPTPTVTATWHPWTPPPTGNPTPTVTGTVVTTTPILPCVGDNCNNEEPPYLIIAIGVMVFSLVYISTGRKKRRK